MEGMTFSTFRKAANGTDGMPRMPAAVFIDILVCVSLRSSAMTRASVHLDNRRGVDHPDYLTARHQRADDSEPARLSNSASGMSKYSTA